MMRVLSATHPHTGFTVCFLCCMWPESKENSLLKEMAEQRATDVQTGKDLDAFMQKSADSLGDLLDAAVPIGVELLDWDSTIERMLPPETFLEKQWAHLRVNGVRGAKIPFDEAPRTVVFHDWDKLIGLLANFVAGAKAFLSIQSSLSAEVPNSTGGRRLRNHRSQPY